MVLVEMVNLGNVSVFTIGDKCSYINDKKKLIVSTIIKTKINLKFPFGDDYYKLKTTKGHIVLKHESELTLVESIRIKKLEKILKYVRKELKN